MAKVLGKGLEALIKNYSQDNKNSQTMIAVNSIITNQHQPRTNFDSKKMNMLIDSIKEKGIIQPLTVRKNKENNFELIAGERRLRAAKVIGLNTVPVFIISVNNIAEMMELALIENIQRVDLNPMEESRAYHRLTDEFSLTHQEVADLVGKSRTAISNLLRLMNLNNDVKRFLENGDIEMGHARALLALESHKQSEAARNIITKSLTVREAENLIRRLQKPSVAKTKHNTLDPDTRRLQEGLAETLGAKVSIQHSAKGKGKLVINYTSLDELDGILAHIK